MLVPIALRANTHTRVQAVAIVCIRTICDERFVWRGPECLTLLLVSIRTRNIDDGLWIIVMPEMRGDDRCESCNFFRIRLHLYIFRNSSIHKTWIIICIFYIQNLNKYSRVYHTDVTAVSDHRQPKTAATTNQTHHWARSRTASSRRCCPGDASSAADDGPPPDAMTATTIPRVPASVVYRA